MASYDYKCKECEKDFTIEKSMNDNSQPVCTACCSTNVERIWGKIQLKGSGSKENSSSCSSSCSKSSCSGCSCG